MPIMMSDNEWQFSGWTECRAVEEEPRSPKEEPRSPKEEPRSLWLDRMPAIRLEHLSHHHGRRPEMPHVAPRNLELDLSAQPELR
jgi:hypothetical protein